MISLHCRECIDHQGWATDNPLLRRDPEDVCRTCLGSGVLRCWCGQPATVTELVDPAVTPAAWTVTPGGPDRWPAAVRCEAHVGHGELYPPWHPGPVDLELADPERDWWAA